MQQRVCLWNLHLKNRKSLKGKIELEIAKNLQILFAEFAVQKILKRYTEVAKILVLEAEIGEFTAFATDALCYLKILKNFQETGHKLILIFKP